MKTLHDSTLIDYSDLSDALLGLTAKRQSVLLHTHNLGSAPPSELPPGDNVATADAPLPNTHFRPSSVFTINEAFPMEIGRSQESNIVLFHEVKKINRKKGPSHTRAERILDLTHILERRRTIMDAGIIRIMKREKEIAVNSLAIKVYAWISCSWPMRIASHLFVCCYTYCAAILPTYVHTSYHNARYSKEAL